MVAKHKKLKTKKTAPKHKVVEPVQSIPTPIDAAVNTSPNVVSVTVENPQPIIPTEPVPQTVSQPQVIAASSSMDSAIPPTAPLQPAAVPLASQASSVPPQEPQNITLPSSSSKKNIAWIMLFVVLVGMAVVGGIFVYQKYMGKSSNKTLSTAVSPSPTAKPSATAAPTEAEVDLSKYEIKVLNGSEVAGQAGKQKENLETEGFTVSDIGNATNSNYERTVIQVKKEVDKAFVSELRKVLEKTFVVEKATVDLPEDADNDVIVIIGSKKI